MRRLALTCAGLALFAVLVSAHLWRHLRDERQPQTQADVVAPEPAVQAAPAPMPSQPALASQSSVQNVQQPVRAPASPDAAALIPDSVRYEAQLLQDPEYRDAEFAQVRRRMMSDYPGIAEELNLSEEQATALLDLLANGQIERRSANVFTEPGREPDIAAMEEMARKRQEAYVRQQDSLGTLLGPVTYEQFKQFEAGRAQRVQAHGLGRTLASAGHPLSPGQQRSLTAAFVAEQALKRKQVNPADWSDSATIIGAQGETNQRLIDTLRPTLSAEQIDALQEILDDELARRSAVLRARQQGQSLQ